VRQTTTSVSMCSCVTSTAAGDTTQTRDRRWTSNSGHDDGRRQATEVVYDLDVRTYEVLRAPTSTPHLVLLVLPEDESLWVQQTEDELVLRRCAYWISFRGCGHNESGHHPHSHPKGQRLLPEAVRALMAEQREEPPS
jgi:hypothetical protein